MAAGDTPTTVPSALGISPLPSGESVEEKFHRLAATWKKAVALLSSSRARESHPAYLDIIALGPSVVPLLLRDLEANETHWFTALSRITGVNPIPDADAGNVPNMAKAWLDWARETGYRW
jgi:hypothetical protein